MKRLFCTFLVTMSAFTVLAQDAPQAGHAPAQSHHDAHGMKGTQRVTLGLGHTHVSKGKVDGDTK